MDRDSFSHDQDLIKFLKGLESEKAEYPAELLAARKKLFIEQLEQRTQLESANQVTAKDQTLMDIFRSLKALDPEYPPEKRARRRSIFKQQIEEISRSSVWNILRSSIRNLFAGFATSTHTTSRKFTHASVVAAGIAMLAFVAYALYGNVIPSYSAFLPQNEIAPAVSSSLKTPTPQAEVICKDGYEPPLCLAQELDDSQDLTYPGNGKARPAVAKDTVPGFENIHNAAYVNDGLYGPGASWVSKSPNSWIKIDLGDATDIDTVAFSRDRLGTLNDGDPGQFVIAVAIADNIYADGNSSNDEFEYISVYNSRQAGFDGIISGSETVTASFKLQKARFIKITFENAGTAIDEVEAFVSKPSPADQEPTAASPGEEASSEPATLVPTDTALPPPDTATAISVPTDTPLPVNTATPIPVDTATPVPVDTGTPVPTDPPPTPEDTAVPTEAIVPPPIDTVFPPPIDVPVPVPLPTEEPIPTEAGIEWVH